MVSSRSLPVLMPHVPGQRWSCHSCGHCCKALVGHLFEDDIRKLDEQNWAAELGVAPYVRLGRGWVLNKKADESCVFLDENNRCRVHAKFGEAAKPFACRIFPFSVRPVGRGWQASFRFDCPSSTSSKGKPIAEYAAWLRKLSSELAHTAAAGEDVADLQPGVRATVGETDTVTERFVHWFQNREQSVFHRLIGAARLAATLHGAKFATVRGSRFSELLDVLFGALPSECAALPQPPSARQSGLLRQLVFAHAEHVSHTEATGGMFARMRRRWRQLRTARAFLKGRGSIPYLAGFEMESQISDLKLAQSAAGVREGIHAPATFPGARIPSRTSVVPSFAAIDPVGVEPHDVAAIDDLLIRYVTARLQGRSCFGEGYYHWPVFAGIGALCLSVAGAGWLARYRAVLAGRNAILFDDVAFALGVVDRAATRLPALGMNAERIRVAYLCRDDGLARLIWWYWAGGRN